MKIDSFFKFYNYKSTKEFPILNTYRQFSSKSWEFKTALEF